MKKIILLSIILLAGCASPYPADIAQQRAARCLPHTGCASRYETPEQFEQRKILEEATAIDEQAKSVQREKDMAFCRYEATKATASGPRGYNSMYNRQVEIIGLCMNSKGYAEY